MKKSLIALAVAGALTAPMVAQADATLYGSFRMGLVGADGADMDLRDESTRIGIKGDVDLGMENTKGLFQWEANVATTDNDGDMFKARLALMGLTGDWGTALVGRQYHPYYTMVNSHTNIFQGTDADFGEALALGNAQHKRVDNTIAYASPVMSGFQVVAGAVIAGDGSDSNDNFDSEVDGYNIGAQFTGVEGLRVSASYGNVDADVASGYGFESDIWGLGATYKIGDFTVAGKYEEREDSYAVTGASTDIDWTVWELAGMYQMGATSFKARYGNIEADISGAFGGVTAADSTDGDQWGVEVEHKLGNRGYVWVGYTDFDEEAAGLAALQQNVNATKAVSEDLWMVGYRLDF
ncbi:MAG: porin [Marinobacterium sp.]